MATTTAAKTAAKTKKSKASGTKKDVYTEAVGRRKTSVARVRIKPSTQKTVWLMNNRGGEKYFPTEELRLIINRPLSFAGGGHHHISVIVRGGGIHSQAEAVAMGLARALVKAEPAIKAPVKKAGLLTRDDRMKERRKFGLKKARKSPQWSKR